MNLLRWFLELRAARRRARPSYIRAYERAVAAGIVVPLYGPPRDDDEPPPDTPSADAKRLPDEPLADAVARPSDAVRAAGSRWGRKR